MILIIFDFGSLSEQSSKNINTNYRWTAMIIPYMTTALAISTNVGEDALIALVAIILLAFLFYSIKIVREYQRIVVFRFGRALAQKGPGIVFIYPIIDVPVRVDLRERFLTIPHQTCITKDNAPVDVDFIIYFKVISASDSVIQVQNFEGAAMGIATTTLRAVVGDINLDEVLSKRENINAILRTKLDEVTTRWGVKVTNVEIREILPPKNVSDAMSLVITSLCSAVALSIAAFIDSGSPLFSAGISKNSLIAIAMFSCVNISYSSFLEYKCGAITRNPREDKRLE